MAAENQVMCFIRGCFAYFRFKIKSARNCLVYGGRTLSCQLPWGTKLLWTIEEIQKKKKTTTTVIPEVWDERRRKLNIVWEGRGVWRIFIFLGQNYAKNFNLHCSSFNDLNV